MCNNISCLQYLRNHFHYIVRNDERKSIRAKFHNISNDEDCVLILSNLNTVTLVRRLISLKDTRFGHFLINRRPFAGAIKRFCKL